MLLFVWIYLINLLFIFICFEYRYKDKKIEERKDNNVWNKEIDNMFREMNGTCSSDDSNDTMLNQLDTKIDAVKNIHVSCVDTQFIEERKDVCTANDAKINPSPVYSNINNVHDSQIFEIGNKTLEEVIPLFTKKSESSKSQNIINNGNKDASAFLNNDNIEKPTIIKLLINITFN